MKRLINIAGAFLVVCLALYTASCVITEFHDYAPPWANEAALRRAPVLMVYFTTVLTLIVGFTILGVINRVFK